MLRYWIYWVLGIGLLVGFALGCDTAISGDSMANQPPDTNLSVRDTSLVDNLGEDGRLASTVSVSWSGVDADGFVAQYELRFFANEDRTTIGPDDGWTATTRLDTLVLLPIKLRESTANVRFEVRAIDNMGVKDPTPAHTVFPIQNAPPTIRFNQFELPAGESFSIFSMSWVADDPEGVQNIDRIEVSLNDSTQFVALPADTEFATFVSEDDQLDETRARVYLGRGFQSTNLYVPKLKLEALNTFYVRAVDQTDTTSVRIEHEWTVRRKTSDVLYVNDYRKEFESVVQTYHTNLLADYLPAGYPIDIWNISQPFLSGSSGSAQRSDAVPATVDPTLRQALARYRHIYWVSTNTTNTSVGNNLPIVASVFDLFFENGGTMMVHSPIALPNNPEDNIGNPAILLMPLSELVTFPDSLRTSLRVPNNGAVTPVNAVPGVNDPLPALASKRLLIGTLPYLVGGNSVALYTSDYTYRTRVGNRQGPWTGPATIASISSDQRVALFALPLLNEVSGEDFFEGADGDPNAPRQAIFRILESLGFPK